MIFLSFFAYIRIHNIIIFIYYFVFQKIPHFIV
jgi:hypothetical protein